jgi:uncharacterized membrane protein SpoIIM required for sporulation
MKVVDRLADREKDWRELQVRIARIDGTRMRKVPPGDILRIGDLYRSACADLMLAEAHDLPRDTVAYLHALVGRAHNVVYRARGFHVADWAKVILDEVPRRLRADPMLRFSALVFWGIFFVCAFVAAAQPGYAASVLGEHSVEQMEEMYRQPLDGSESSEKLGRSDSMMAGFYIFNNAGIGLRCYAWGIFFGIGTLWTLATNAISIGLIFGHMATTPQAPNFFTFVTAHGPFELTAIVFSGAAGLRLGSGLIFTRGQSRLASLKREGARSLPIVGVATILFVFAAFLEGFVSASPLPYWSKATIALASASLLAFYLFALGRGGRRPSGLNSNVG